MAASTRPACLSLSQPYPMKTDARDAVPHLGTARAKVHAAQVPPGSRAARLLPGAYFHDAWAIRAARPELDPLSQFLRVARTTPAWIEAAMGMRNRIVRRLGLKDLGTLSQLKPDRPATDYREGDRVGIFTLLERHSDEVLLGDRDRHLDVVLSVHRATDAAAPGALITVSTIVHVHNALGRLYMLPVTPAHRVIARQMTAAVGRA